MVWATLSVPAIHVLVGQKAGLAGYYAPPLSSWLRWMPVSRPSGTRNLLRRVLGTVNPWTCTPLAATAFTVIAMIGLALSSP